MNTNDTVTTLPQALAVICYIVFLIYAVVTLFMKQYELTRWALVMMMLYAIRSDTAGRDSKEEDK